VGHSLENVFSSLEGKAFSSEVALFTNNQPGGSHAERNHQLFFGCDLDRAVLDSLLAQGLTDQRRDTNDRITGRTRMKKQDVTGSMDRAPSAVDEAIAEQVQTELDDLPRAFARKVAKKVHPPYDSSSPHMVRVWAEHFRLEPQVQRALAALSDDVHHLVVDQVRPPYNPSSLERVRVLADQFKGSM
jgi:hypothetical protein